MEKTFPNLKSYCQQNGYEFQIVDMRWGIRDEASNDHMTTEICLQELENCQKYSAGPNFLVCLNNDFGVDDDECMVSSYTLMLFD